MVTTTADVDSDGDGVVDSAAEKARVRSEPRGFFADQFEVGQCWSTQISDLF
jgi:hypothetical protein